MIKFIFFLSVVLFFVGALTAYYFGIVPTSVGIHSKFYASSNVAMDGFDMTIFHTQKKSQLGDVRFNYKYGETNWFFTSSINKKRFASKPGKFLPQFGGYCTYTMSKGFTYPPDPKVWHIDKSKIYFFKDIESKKNALSDWKNVLKNAKMHWR
ncbi:MAG: YHS domain-containing (seleno)protein [Melioribacteraceae bacterium]|nr:YHS domain-containing (seleno)protein [Melioribacteraceae bacterium]